MFRGGMDISPDIADQGVEPASRHRRLTSKLANTPRRGKEPKDLLARDRARACPNGGTGVQWKNKKQQELH